MAPPRGFVPWNKGRTGIYSDKTLGKISAASSGRKQSLQARAKNAAAHLGLKKSLECREKISASLLGHSTSLETRAKISKDHIGRTHSLETRVRMSSTHTKYKTPAERLVAEQGLGRARAHRRRTREYNAPGNHTAADERDVMKASSGKCYYCCKKRPLTIDHVVPISRGGSNGRANLVAACKSCNSRKRDSLWRIL